MWRTPLYSLFVVPCKQKTNSFFRLVENGRVMTMMMCNSAHIPQNLYLPNREARAHSVQVSPSCSDGHASLSVPNIAFRLVSAYFTSSHFYVFAVWRRTQPNHIVFLLSSREESLCRCAIMLYVVMRILLGKGLSLAFDVKRQIIPLRMALIASSGCRFG